MNLTIEGGVSVKLLTKSTKCDEDIIIEAEKDVDNLTFIKRYLANDLPSTFTVPENVVTLGFGAFDGMGLKRVTLPTTLDYMDIGVFDKDLLYLTFRSTPSYMSKYALSSCYNLSSIKVPWSEGAVEGAPWGATSATITYNYVG